MDVPEDLYIYLFPSSTKYLIPLFNFHIAFSEITHRALQHLFQYTCGKLLHMILLFEHQYSNALLSLQHDLKFNKTQLSMTLTI